MSDHPFSQAQADMRSGYFSGVPGMAVSGVAWLTAGAVAAEGTFWFLAGIAIACGMHFLRVEWFFPAMLLPVGGRYLTFQSLYGMRAYWLPAGCCASSAWQWPRRVSA